MGFLGFSTNWFLTTFLMLSLPFIYLLSKLVLHSNQTRVPWIHSALLWLLAFLCFSCMFPSLSRVHIEILPILWGSPQIAISPWRLSWCHWQYMISPSLGTWCILFGILFLSLALLDLVWVICVFTHEILRVECGTYSFHSPYHPK